MKTRNKQSYPDLTQKPFPQNKAPDSYQQPIKNINNGKAIFQNSKISKVTMLAALLSLSAASSQASQINLQSISSFPSTKNDGVTPDKYISYIQLNGSSGLVIPLNDIGLTTKQSYTIQLWMKPQVANFGKIYQYAVSFDDSLECYYSGTDEFMCDSDNKGLKLKASTTSVIYNQWVHFTVAGDPIASQSYLQLEQNGGHIIATDSESYLNLQQKYEPFRVCIGSCTSDYVFQGGLREFKFFSQYVNQTRATVLKNHYMLWDTPLLAYYRFTEANVLGSEILYQKAQITSGTFTSQRDYSINDICYPINNYLQLYKFKTSNDFQPLALDGRYNPQQSNWGYTLSTWLLLNSTTCYQSNPTLARQNCYLFLLQDAFMIFSPAPNQIAAYFFNQKAYYMYQSKSINVPYNQWFNLQFQANQYTGYDIKVYDILGRLMNDVSESRNLQEVLVQNRQLVIFSQFVGIAKNFVLYIISLPLPISFPKVDFTVVDPYIIDNNCLIYLEFQQQFVFSNNPEQMKNLCRSYTYGQLPISLTYDDDYIGTYYKTYTSASNDGLITTNSKFDGVSCEDGYEILEIETASSVISTQTLYAISQSPNVTIEFWFKSQVPMIRTQYLLSLFGNIRQKEYFSFFYESSNNKKLICAPFGYSSTTSPLVAFNGYNDVNSQVSGWYHIACQYQSQNQINGYLYNSNNVEEQQVTSLSSSNLVLPADTYSIYVGNNPSFMYGTIGTRFKEVKFWGYQRLLSDIKYWRFRQMDPRQYSSNQLFIYLRMNEGSYREYNAASLIDTTLSYPVVSFQGVQYQQDSNITICPATTFLSASKNCYLDPIQYVDGAIYPIYNPSNSSLYWYFSADESIMMDSSVLTLIRTSWLFDDITTQAITTKNTWYKQGIDLKVPSTVFNDESMYNVRLNFSNSDLSYVQYKNFQFVPRSCQYYILSGGDAYTNFLNYTQTQSMYNITFTFVPVQLKTYCNDISFYNQVLPNINYRFSPPLTQTPMMNFTLNSDQSILVTIPAPEQAKFPLQQNVSMIFTIQYDNSYYIQQNVTVPSNKTFQNVKQTIYFNIIGQSLNTTISSNSTQIYTGEGVTLQAQSTISNSNSNDYNRLQYKWVCPQIFSAICPTTNSTGFTITAAQFIAANGVYGNYYQFQIQINYTNSLGEQYSDQKSISIVWQNLISPEFQITAPTTVLSTADNQSFTIQFNSYPTVASIPSTISIIWSIVPNISSSSYLITNDNTNLTVRANGFLTTTTYNVTVTAINQNGTASSTKSHQIQFTTGLPPQGGTVTINPFIGYVGQTNLTVSILNWQSSFPPVQFIVWSTTNSAGNTPNKALSGWIPSTQTFKFVPTDTNPYLIEVTDMFGEVEYIKNTPAIVAPNNNAGNGTTISLIQQQQQLQIILDTTSIADKYTQLTQFASTQLNTTTDTSSQSSSSTDSSNSSTNAAQILAQTQSKIAIVDSMQTDTQQILAQLTNDSDSSIVSKGALTVLNVILADTNTLTSDLVQKTVDVIENILNQDPTIVNNLLNDQTFLNNFAQSISSLMNYNSAQSNSGRLLQQDEVTNLNDQIRQLMETLQDSLCQQAVQNSGSQTQVTQAYSLYAQKFTFDNTIQNDTFQYIDDSVSGVTFNVPQITQSLEQTSTSILDTFCILSTFLQTTNTVYQTTTQKQYSPQIVEYEIYNPRTQTVYAPTLYTPQDNVMLEFAVDPSTFLNNQTICMSFSNSTNTWSGDYCITTINTIRNSLQCSCTIIDAIEYALINDYTRALGPQIYFSAKASSDSDNLTVEQSYSFLMMAALLLLVMFGLPVTSIIFDKRDLNSSTCKELDKTVLKVIDKLSKISEKPNQYWVLRQIEVQENIINSKSMFSMIMQEIHPLINLLSKYSVEQPRIIRYATFSFQISLFALLVTLVFNPNYRQGQTSRIEDGLDQHDIQQVIILGIVGMIILIPASFITRTIERKIKNKPSPNDSLKQTDQSKNQQYLPEINGVNEANTLQISPNKILHTNQMILHKNMSYTVESQRPSLNIVGQQEQSQELQLVQKCRPLFYILLACGYILSISSIALCFVYSSQMPVSNQYCLVSAFYIGFIGSVVLSNLLRVAVNALLINSYEHSKGVKKFIIGLVMARETMELIKTNKMIKEAVSKKDSKHGTHSQLIHKEKLENEEMPGNTTSKNLTGGIHNMSRGNSIDISKAVLDFQKPLSEHENQDIQNDSVCLEQLEEIDDALHSLSISPKELKHTHQSHINIEDVDYDLNSSVDVRAESIESQNMKSIYPMTNSVMMNGSFGTKGLFKSLRKDKNSDQNVGSTRSFKQSKNTSPSQRLNSLTGSGDGQRYSQIGQLNQSNQSNNEEDYQLSCDDSNRQK